MLPVTIRSRRRVWALALLVCASIFVAVVWLARRTPDAPRELESKPPERAEPVVVVESEPLTAERSSLAALPRIRVRALPAHEPIEGASISIRMPGASDGTTLRTGSDGVTELPIAFSDRVEIQVSADRHFPILDVRDDIAMSAELIYDLHPSGTLVVKVLQEDGAPVPGAFIQVFPEQPVSTLPQGASDRPRIWPELLSPRLKWKGPATPMRRVSGTDQDGELVLENLPCDVPLAVTASEVGAPLRSLATIPSTTRREVVEFRVISQGCIRGTLQWSDGSPARDVKVQSLEEDARGLQSPPVRPGKDGAFELCGLPFGRVRWRVDLMSELSRCTTIDAPVVDVGVIQLPKLHPFEVHVFTSDAPQGPLYVSLYAKIYHEGKYIGEEHVSNIGRMRTKLPAGAVQVDIVTTAGRNPLASRSATVPGDPLEIQIDGMFATLRIRNPPVKKGTHFAIRLSPQSDVDAPSGTRPRRAIQLHSGHSPCPFAWSDTELGVMMVPPGNYEVLLCEDARVAIRLGRVTLKAGQTTTLVPEDSTPGSIHGRIKDTSGKPLARVPVTAGLAAFERQSSEQERKQAISDDEGQFSFNHLTPGRWVVFPASLHAFSSEARVIEVPPATSVDVDLVSGAVGRIVGRVFRGERPFPNASVFLGQADAYSSTTARADAHGEYEFTGVSPGSYRIQATMEAPDETLFVARYADLRAGEKLRVDFKPDVDPVRILVQRNGAVFTDWEYGMAFTSSGHGWLTTYPSDPTAFFAPKLDPGPVLLLLGAPKTFASPTNHPTWTYYAAFVDKVPDAATVVNARVDGPDIIVEAREPGGALPSARLEEIGSFRDFFGPDPFYGFVYVDEAPGRRRFPDVPIGARVVVEMGSSPEDDRVDLRVESSRDITLSWPPQR